ncbi:MAG: hypothetical protein E7658_00505 [Ruminococcaceae bacterium]|nr:hypothetical protein [Oscillospiraceae bacterium]
MKIHVKKMFAALFAGILLLSGCNTQPTVPETDAVITETEAATEAAPETPDLTPAKHQITVDEINSLLAANNLQTNIHSKLPYPAVHAGQQMRVCHTERGTYIAFSRDFGYETDIAQFIVAKIDNDNNVTLLYFGEYAADGSTVPVNVGQDINGNIVVTSATVPVWGQPCKCTAPDLNVYIFDAETDEMSRYSADAVLDEDVDGVLASGEAWLGYPQAMFDFENRKVYMFFNGTSTYDFVLEWFTFDLESREWEKHSNYQRFEGIGRHGYFFPFPDGNGGAYIVANRNAENSVVADQLVLAEGNGVLYTYVFDEMRLFHIPDLTSSENITWTIIHEAYSERGHEGIWSCISNTSYGGAFMDADGYLHVTYQYYISDMINNPGGVDYSKLDPDMQYRHAIFDGMECIYNEKMDIEDTDWLYLKPQITQAADGTLYMIVAKNQSSPLMIKVYKAKDALGKAWEQVSVNTVDENKSLRCFSMSQARDGSVQDNIVSCFAYTPYTDPELGYRRTITTFNLSLEDYSTTEPVDVLAGYDIQYDERVDERVPAMAHQTKVIHTENGTYAAFVYDHNFDMRKDYFHIVKIDNEKNVQILYSGEYTSRQDKVLTIQMLPDGKIYICPPTGCTLYTLDTSTDTVTLVETAQYSDRYSAIRQSDLLPHPEAGKAYLVCDMSSVFRISVYTIDTEAMTISKSPKNASFDTKLMGDYSHYYVISDGGTGAYLVATRELNKQEFVKNQLEIGEKLTIHGHTNYIDDSIMLFYIPDLSTGKTTCIEIEAPYEAEGSAGIWSAVNMKDNGDVYLDSEGKLHVFYTYYHHDFDEIDALSNTERHAATLKHYHAIYEGSALVSKEELSIDDLTMDSSIRMAETTDGTDYLLVCNIGEEKAKIDVYFETEEGWALTQTKELGDFTAESFSVSAPRGGSVQDNAIDCIIYGADNDVYFTTVTFE